MQHINSVKKPEYVVVNMMQLWVTMGCGDGNNFYKLLPVCCQHHQDGKGIINTNICINKQAWDLSHFSYEKDKIDCKDRWLQCDKLINISENDFSFLKQLLVILNNKHSVYFTTKTNNFFVLHLVKKIF